ncbi:MAG: FmdB family transcriptional regulator [Chloroflexi bacterium]|nr:FmdB family transcriptional regulator [Chloroflexota bacterium]
MPTYEYECKSCHNRFEMRQSFSSEPVATCPVCMNGANRVFHAVPVVFKGSGFYVNDYGKGSRVGSAADADSSKKKDESDSGADSKSESTSKSETKAETQSKPKSDAKSKTAAATPKSD